MLRAHNKISGTVIRQYEEKNFSSKIYFEYVSKTKITKFSILNKPERVELSNSWVWITIFTGVGLLINF